MMREPPGTWCYDRIVIIVALTNTSFWSKMQCLFAIVLLMLLNSSCPLFRSNSACSELNHSFLLCFSLFCFAQNQSVLSQGQWDFLAMASLPAPCTTCRWCLTAQASLAPCCRSARLTPSSTSRKASPVWTSIHRHAWIRPTLQSATARCHRICPSMY